MYRRNAKGATAALWMTSKVKENMIDSPSRCCCVKENCMQSAGLERKSDYFSCMYGDVQKIDARSGKMQASSPSIKPVRLGAGCHSMRQRAIPCTPE
jgi:hypothetical protein